VIIDERLGRRVAEYLGLSVTGTLGVLAKAQSTGLIPSFHEAAQAMRQQGIHYDAGLITRLTQHLGEMAK
jgi:predicted nucleic acid-binding protein